MCGGGKSGRDLDDDYENEDDGGCDVSDADGGDRAVSKGRRDLMM